MTPEIQYVVSDVVNMVSGVSWSISLRNAEDCSALAGYAESSVLPTASLGKLLLLLETARRCVENPKLLDVTLSRTSVPRVGQAGLWQYMRVDDLPLADVALLVASHSDNWATNVLLRYIGLDEVDRLRVAIGLHRTRLLDRVRSERDSERHPVALSVGSADELSMFMARMASKTLLSEQASTQLEKWLATDADLSLVSASFGLDPLAHVVPAKISLRHKTGSDIGTKAEAGAARGARTGVAYAVIAHWEESDPKSEEAVQAGMWRIGSCIRDFLMS